MSTLAERVKAQMEAKQLSNKELAIAAGVRPPTAHNWGSGKTKAIKGEPLLRAAAAFGVNPHWLATGRGPKYPADGVIEPVVREAGATYGEPADPWILEAIKILTHMAPEDRRAAVLNLRVFSHNLGPPGNGQNLPVAA